MILRKKHATVATVLILVLVVLLVAFLLMRTEEEPQNQLVATPALTVTDIETSVTVSSDTNKERQQHAGARLIERFKVTETGG
ncbi:hypothetical protein KTR10_01680 [Candidatus Kaiserbacteria bacterium]|nr:hypothetical protein [Candidatus Kaiserbacteria bacterium]